jgi:hypothetical protein
MYETGSALEAAGASQEARVRHALPPRRRRAFLLLAALCVAIVAIRTALVCAFGNSLPFWDEWDALVGFQMHNAVLGVLSLRDLFEPHVDHPVAMTRALIALLFWLNHYQFDNLPVALLNGPLYAAAWAIPTWRFATHPVARMRWFALLFGIAGLAPTDWENILTGFQSAFYFLVASAMVTLWIAASTRGRSPLSVIGFGLVATVGCFTLGSGFVAATVAVFVFWLRARRETSLRQSLLVRSAIGIGITAFGFFLHSLSLGSRVSHPLAWHAVLDAVSCLAWPYAGNVVVALLASVPFVAFAVRLVRGARAPTTDWFVFGIGLWVTVHAAMFAVGRQVDGTILPSRYLLILQFWPLLNVYCIARLCGSAASAFSGRRARLVAVLPAMAACTLLAFLAGHLPGELQQLRLRGESFVEQANRVALFVRAHDASALDATGLQIPYPDPKRLKLLLADNAVQKMLPPNVRRPIPLFVPRTGAEPTFVQNGIPPELPQLPGIFTLGSFGPHDSPGTTSFDSTLTDFPYVLFHTAGDFGKPGLSLQVDCRLGCPPREVRPMDSTPGWHEVVVAAPRPYFRILAQDSSSEGWLAFTAPIEEGALGAASRALSDALHAHGLLISALVMGVIALLVWIAWRQSYAEVDDPPEPPEPAAAPAATGALIRDLPAGGRTAGELAANPEIDSLLPGKAIAWYRHHRTGVTMAALAALTLVVMILRRPDQWSAPYVWVEDGAVMLPDFIANGWRSLLHPAAGYYLLPTKLILAISATLSFRWLPELEYWLTMLFTGAVLAAFAFSPIRLRWRAACALSLLALPIDSEVYGTSAYAFWWGSLLAVLPLLWRADAPRHLTLRTAYLVVGGLSSPLIIALTPLYVIRAAWQRDRTAFYDLVVATGVAAIQASTVAQSGQRIGVGEAPNVALFIRKFLGYFIYVPAQETGHVAATLVVGLLLLAILVAFSVRYRSELGRGYFLIIGAFLLAALASAVRSPLAGIHPAYAGPRYFFLPFAFLAMSIVQLAALRDRYVQAIAVAIAALMMRNALDIGRRYHDHLDWRANVAACVASEEFAMPIHFDGRAEAAWKAKLTGADCRKVINRSWMDARVVTGAVAPSRATLGAAQ